MMLEMLLPFPISMLIAIGGSLRNGSCGEERRSATHSNRFYDFA